MLPVFEFGTLSAVASDWILTHGLTIAAIVIGAFVARSVLGLLLERVIRRAVTARSFNSVEAEKKREDTLIQIGGSSLRILTWLVAGMMVLSEVGVDIAPLIAAAGVAGLALGFGAQYLIRDVIAGIFIILENQFRVGDVVCLDSTCGLVEEITLRVTTVRDLDGVVHHVPHGTVSKVSNLSKDFARVNLDIGIAYDSNLTEVIEVVNRVGRELAEDEGWKGRIVSPPTFLRVDSFADSAIIIKILGDTKPLKQWEVAGELRKRLKIAFDEAGIEIPFPQRVVHNA